MTWRIEGDDLHVADPVPDPVRDALLEWIGFHGIDPWLVPLPCTITRDVPGRAVTVEEMEADPDRIRINGHPFPRRDENGCWVIRRVRHQGEAPPLPWPDLQRLSTMQAQP